MRNLYLFYAVFAFLALIGTTQGRVYLQIDNFLQSQPPITVTVPSSVDSQDDTYWWNPYAYQPGRPPAGSFRLTESAIGGQRDIILGFEGFTPSNTVGIAAIASRRGSIAFDLDYVGGAYYQYDGIDHTRGDGIFRDSTVLPGALFNYLPGIGSYRNTTLYSERNSDNQTVDLTSGGAAVGIHINVITDHPCYYYIDMLSPAGVNISLAFVPPESEQSAGVDFFFRFDDARWVVYQGQTNAFSFTQVAAVQIRIWSFDNSENPGDQTSQAIDTSFAQLWTYGYEVTGIVQIDCQCDGTPESAATNVLLSIARTSSPSTVITTTSSDSNGNFRFAGNYILESTSYTVCLVDGTQARCSNTPQCQTVVIGNNGVDPTALVYRITNPSTITPPANVQINCGECNTTACLGTATISDCSGNLNPVNTFSDRQTGNCPTVITRTFSAGGLFATQTITVVDNVAPVITVQAQSVSNQCGNQSPTYATFLSNRGGAQATDCSAFTWSNDGGAAPNQCSSTTVTFIATDACGNSDQTSRTTATYSVLDTTAPVFTTQAQDSSTQCNQNGSDFQALNTWVNNRGGAVATDNCGTVTYSNNFDDSQVVRSCLSQTTVTFVATDSCNNVATTTATFTIQDTSAPVITTQAQNQTAECNAADNSAFNNFLANHAGAQATDQCQGSNGLTWTNNFVGTAPSGCNANSGPVTFSVTDGCGTTATTTATFTVTDTVAPVLTSPASALNVDCSDASSNNQLQSWLANNGGATATDACSGVTWSNNFNSTQGGSCSQRPVTFTATDSCGRQVRTTATYSINDNTAPTLTLGQPQLTVSCDSDTSTAFFAWLTSYAGGSVVDNCASSSQITIRTNYTSQTAPQRGCLVNTYVAFTATDPCGNTSPAQVGVFTIQDVDAPVITQSATSVNSECGATGSTTTSYQSFLSNRGGAQATDTCSGVTFSNDAPATPTFDGCSGTTTVTFTARDACGLTATTTATYTIADTQPPTITRAAQPLTEECTNGTQSSGLTSWLNNHGGSTATDACSSVTWTNNFVGLSGGCNSSAVVTFTATDACGFSVATTATYTVRDTRPPVITTPAQNLTVSCQSDTQSQILNWVNNNGGAVATDACTGNSNELVWTRSLFDNVVGCAFATVTFTVTDPCGLSASTTATFTSVDNQAPTFNPPAQDLTVECDGNGNVNDYQSYVASHGGAVAVDSCAFSFTWTSNAPSTGPTTCGTRSITFTVVDNCNNVARTTANFIVQDSQAPVFTSLPSDLVVECGDNSQLNTWLSTNGGAVASDVCAATVSYSNVAGTPTGNSTCGSTRPYTFRATDSCGNFATATANFITRDTTPPTLTRPVQDASFECDGTGNNNQIQQWIASHGGATATDSCTNNVSWTDNYSGSGPLTCTTTTVTFTAADQCGNTVSSTGQLTITDTTNPAFTFFPQDYTVPCDADTSVELLGTATASDVCSGSLFVSLSETSFDEPAQGNCPGDHIITRTFSATDDCGNSISRDQTITVQIVRSSGPCDPTGCECDSCCPPPIASDCLPADCEASSCQRTPCTASACTCSNGRDTRDVALGFQSEDDLIEPLPQCKPVYIYVNDDDDTEKEVDATGVAKQRMLVTNKPLHESVLKNKSDASSLGLSLIVALFALVVLLF